LYHPSLHQGQCLVLLSTECTLRLVFCKAVDRNIVTIPRSSPLYTEQHSVHAESIVVCPLFSLFCVIEGSVCDQGFGSYVVETVCM
jgi:hypothetical protein